VFEPPKPLRKAQRIERGSRAASHRLNVWQRNNHCNNWKSGSKCDQ
jgi:hypothetical protein